MTPTHSSAGARASPRCLGAFRVHWRIDAPEAAMIGSDARTGVTNAGGDRDRLRRDQPALFDGLPDVVTNALARAVVIPLKFKEQ